MFGGTLVAVFTFGMAITNWSSIGAIASPILGKFTGTNFAICQTTIRFNCVVDGDTFWMRGSKIRIADIDTPEISEPKCQSEYDLGMKAQGRLRELLNEGPFDLESTSGRDQDGYGRELRIVAREGKSIGDQLVAEGLARTWAGRREPWC